MNQPRRVLFVLLLATILGAPSAHAADVHTRVELENSRMKLLILRGKKKATDPVGGIGMTQVINKTVAGEPSFNTLFSSMFQVELRCPSDPITFPPIKIPDGEVEFVLLPIEQTELEQPTSNAATMRWMNIAVPGTSQFLNVDVLVRLRSSDEKAVWDFDIQVTDGPYIIYAVRCPYLGFKKIEEDGTDDFFLTPMTGGQLIPDPLDNGNNFEERDPDEGFVTDAFFTYPGNMMSQYMAYYDDTHGFYFQAEDKAGFVKNVYWNSGAPIVAPDKWRLYTYFTHFNKGLKPSGGETQATIEQDLRTFNLRQDLGYDCVFDVFDGDWLDATQIYRNWVTTQNAPFLARGTLRDRVDVEEINKVTTFMVRWGLPMDTDDIDENAEFTKLQQSLQALELVRRRYDPQGTVDFRPFVLLGGYHLTPTGPGGGGWDDEAYPLRDGVAEFIDLMRNPPSQGQIQVKIVAMNRDTTGIATDAAVLPTGLQKGIMYNPDVTPMLAKKVRYRSCVASDWLKTHRTGLIMDVMNESLAGGLAGFNAVATTGTGNFAFNCYAPLVDDPLTVDRNCHLHTVGGGNYLSAGWVNLALEIRAAAATAGVQPLILGMEHSPETMIAHYILVGRSFGFPLDDSLNGVFRTIDNAIPISMFSHLYHDYSFQPSKPPSVTRAMELYVDEDFLLEDLLIMRYRTAQIAMDGRVLRAQVDQSDVNSLPFEGPFIGLDPAVKDEGVYLAALATLRGSLPEYLVFGRTLRKPTVNPMGPTDSVSMDFKLLAVVTTHDIPRVVASAWKDDVGGTVGLVATNFTPDPAVVSFSFDPADYELDPTKSYIIEERIDIETWQDTGFNFDPSMAFTSPNVSVSPMENPGLNPPWRIYRIVEI